MPAPGFEVTLANWYSSFPRYDGSSLIISSFSAVVYACDEDVACLFATQRRKIRL